MDHNMVLSYDYSNWNRRRRQTNAPPSRAITMTMTVCWCHTEHINRCSMTRASPEATGRQHWATTRSTKWGCNMYPLCWPLRWPWRCCGTIPRTLPDGGGLWLSLKPLNATIGQALAPILQNRTRYAGCFGRLIVKKRSSWHVSP